MGSCRARDLTLEMEPLPLLGYPVWHLLQAWGPLGLRVRLAEVRVASCPGGQSGKACCAWG